MTIIPEITNVIPLDDYILFVEFADGVSGEIPLKKWLAKEFFPIGMMRELSKFYYSKR